jgi:homocysteine S-methyltransferase
LEDPELIRDVHLDYLRAGADCIATASYQATLAGFCRRGLSHEESRELLGLSVRLAMEARDEFWAEPSSRIGRQKPLVAASVGPYGAFLADGSEYSGRYDISNSELYDFHRERWHVLAKNQPDIMACETIPSLREVGALLSLVRETRGRSAWISLSCQDGRRLCDGSSVQEAAAACDAEPGVAAVGVNCVSPEQVSSLIRELRKATGKPLLVYPNLGETYDATAKVWRSVPSAAPWEDLVPDWVRLGASGVGGCCRVGPERIRDIRRWLMG